VEEGPPLEERVRLLERWKKDHELMHDEWYGKMRRVLARINKAARAEEIDEEDHPHRRPELNGSTAAPISVLEAKARLGMGGRP
jgi:hypothetical protein